MNTLIIYFYYKLKLSMLFSNSYKEVNKLNFQRCRYSLVAIMLCTTICNFEPPILQIIYIELTPGTRLVWITNNLILNFT